MTEKSNRRLARLNEQFRREITEILRRSVRDPRVGNVIINSVAVTSDLWLARIYVRALEDGTGAEALRGLDAASSFIRRELAAVLQIHRIPELRFLEDKTHTQADRIEEILRELDVGPEKEDDGSADSKPDPDDPTEEPGDR
jgi:ribosome-binding factor A